MSAHYSRFLLNTHSGNEYFNAHIPEDYPLFRVLEKLRRFRKLPPRLRELSALAKKWAIRKYGAPDGGLTDISHWYDDEGYELNPETGKRLSLTEISAQWQPMENDLTVMKVEDIPVPPGGFADPATWEPPPDKEEESETDGPTMH